MTDADGRVSTLLDPSHQLVAGIYRMTFQTSEYWASAGVTSYFHPYVQVRKIDKEEENEEGRVFETLSSFTWKTQWIPNTPDLSLFFFRSSSRLLPVPRSSTTTFPCSSAPSPIPPTVDRRRREIEAVSNTDRKRVKKTHQIKAVVDIS